MYVNMLIGEIGTNALHPALYNTRYKEFYQQAEKVLSENTCVDGR